MIYHWLWLIPLIHSILKELKYADVFLSIFNEHNGTPLLVLSSIFMTYAPSSP